ncbi:adenylosuccinate synthetase [Vulcanimicrobium alpinum]|uniref:Adenylosuccinate synthetase n=1 Tax=Vulcanimicrobium alpinum TaxID=3016050 RepID=A0AAN1XV71_UNVUL|nr:adenylosuccinate synthase [Vulcanimicrobium alpinum]BDE06032.1 adenylosuccinate synthetase [Vulcanimicrobium alpinum]
MIAWTPHRDGERAPVDIVVGIQWGDEGKGRVVDLLARDYGIVARFGGGDNAGHSIEVGETKLALHVVPSGVLVAGTRLFIGGGTVGSLRGLVDELDMLAKLGVDVGRISVSDRAHVVFPYHATLDRLSEKQRGGAAIGTTGRGIGPAYTDRVARIGVTFGDLAKPEAVASKVRQALLARAPLFVGAEELPREEDVVSETLALAKRIVPHVVPGVAWLHEAMERGERVLAEGAQGTMLDVTYGTYPFVTSSHTVAGGACTGLGIGPTSIRGVLGVAKAYCTRVGAGPFPSELLDERGERLRAQGREFGVTTGRSRRCGWYDAVAARYAARLNGLDGLVLTKLDVLSGFERIGIVTGYRRADGTPCGVEGIGDPDLQVDVEEHPGWNEDLRDVRRIAGLPANARAFVERLAALTGVPVVAVSVGPERSALAH